MVKKRLFVTFFCLCLMVGAPHASAQDKYLGEFCWQVFGENNEPFWKYKFGIYQKTGGHLALFGSVDSDNTLSASHGSAIMTDGLIKMTINSADHERGEGLGVWAETLAAELDPATFNGTWNALTLEKPNNDTAVFGVHQSGPINMIACQ